jgi:diguanylate cyclase with GGDEF domain/PAS domain-containing protein
VPRPAPNAPGHWVEWVDQYLPGVDGAEGAAVIAVGRDVTGRHIAESDLADSEARFRDLADNASDVVWRFVVDPRPRFDYMSPSVEKIIGYPPAVFLEDVTRFLDILDDVVARIGGDEFVIVYEPCDPSSDNLILRLESALSLPIQIDATVAVRCPASIGHADTRTVGHDPAALLAAADAAMYEVKRAHERARHARGRPWSAAGLAPGPK